MVKVGVWGLWYRCGRDWGLGVVWVFFVLGLQRNFDWSGNPIEPTYQSERCRWLPVRSGFCFPTLDKIKSSDECVLKPIFDL